MRSNVVRVVGLCVAAVGASVAVAQGPSGSRQQAQVNGFKIGSTTVDLTLPKLETYTADVEVGYRGMDDFFIVREANANIGAGQWEFELGMAWSTFQAGRGHDDDFTLTPTLKYAYTDNLNIEIGLLPVNLGDGANLGFSNNNDFQRSGSQRLDFHDSAANDGTGDTELKLFWQMTQEAGWMPATALWTEVRIPTGEGSADMDATLTLNITKTFCKAARGHLQGFLESANGSRGDGDRAEFGDRRDLQWGAGGGMDFTIDDSNLLLVNYLARSSNYGGNSSSSNIEMGWTHALSDNQWLLLGADYSDNHGEAEGPRWVGKIQWSMSF